MRRICIITLSGEGIYRIYCIFADAANVSTGIGTYTIILIFKTLGLVDNQLSVIICYISINLPFATWMLKGFFDDISIDIEEAAFIDGLGPAQSFLKIVLPLSLPGIATVAIFTFNNCWNEYMLASVFLRSNELQTMTIGLQMFQVQNNADWSTMMAASTIALIPSLIFLLFMQKYMVQGLTAGAVKG